MRNSTYFLILFIFFGCGEKHNARLQISITSRNGDTIQQLKDLYLQSTDQHEYKKSQAENRKMKSFYYKNVSTETPNKFSIVSIDAGNYFGYFSINKNGAEYKIAIDSIHIRPGLNHLTKEVNIGNVKLH